MPSPVVWKRHLENKSTQTGEMLTKVEFRKKDNLGWQNYEVYYKYEQTEERIMHKEDSYMRLFLDNVILRKSCYHCQFKKLKRKSDIGFYFLPIIYLLVWFCIYVYIYIEQNHTALSFNLK